MSEPNLDTTYRRIITSEHLSGSSCTERYNIKSERYGPTPLPTLIPPSPTYFTLFSSLESRKGGNRSKGVRLKTLDGVKIVGQ